MVKLVKYFYLFPVYIEGDSMPITLRQSVDDSRLNTVRLDA